MNNGHSCNYSNRAYENGWIDFGYRMFILLMVFGIISGGIFSLHGQIFGYVLFSIGLVCIPFYIRSMKTTVHSNGSGGKS